MLHDTTKKDLTTAAERRKMGKGEADFYGKAADQKPALKQANVTSSAGVLRPTKCLICGKFMSKADAGIGVQTPNTFGSDRVSGFVHRHCW